MELWIRSQDKECITVVNHLYANDDGEIKQQDDIILGTYKTKERALEVLDEIHDVILANKVLELSTNKISIDELDTEKTSKLSKVIIYEMPK